MYDVHRTRVPDSEAMQRVIEEGNKYISVERLWINPDCGLKTCNRQEGIRQLVNMRVMTRVVRQK